MPSLLSPLPLERTPTERKLDLVIPPVLEPVEPSDQEPSLRLPIKGDPEDIRDRITTARDLIEQYTGLALIKQTWDLRLDDQGTTISNLAVNRLLIGGVPVIRPIIELPKPPFISVVGIYVTDDLNIETTVATSVYWVSAPVTPGTIRSRGRVCLQTGQTWPSHRAFEGFRIRFECGFGDKPKDVPRTLRRAILLLSALERFPGTPSGETMPIKVMDMLRQYRTDFISPWPP